MAVTYQGGTWARVLVDLIVPAIDDGESPATTVSPSCRLLAAFAVSFANVGRGDDRCGVDCLRPYLSVNPSVDPVTHKKGPTDPIICF